MVRDGGKDSACGREPRLGDRSVRQCGRRHREDDRGRWTTARNRWRGSTRIRLSGIDRHLGMSSLIPLNSNRNGHNYFVVGKLKPGVRLEDARAEMRDVAARLEKEHPENRFKSIAITPMRDKVDQRGTDDVVAVVRNRRRRAARRVCQRRPSAVGARSRTWS